MSQPTPEDGSIGEMWEKAVADFKKLVPNKNFDELALSTTPEELRRKIEAFNSDGGKKSKNSRSSRAKDIGLKVLAVAKSLSSVAAKGAELGFGPAEACFGALAILLSIPGKVREFHEFIENIFIELEPVLSQFEIYIEMEKDHTIPANLQLAIHKVMSSFVQLCGAVIAIQQSGRWERIKKHAGRVFAEDRELNDDVERFRRIVNALQIVQDTTVYEVVVETHGAVAEVQRGVDGAGSNVKQLVDEQNKRKNDDNKKAQLASIRKHLDIKDDTNNHPKLRQERVASSRLKGSGNWIVNNEKFKAWADREHSDGDSVLFLSGPPGFGKTSLLSRIIDHLRSQPSGDHRSLVSFYFVDRKGDQETDQNLPRQVRKTDQETVKLAETALKWVAYQLAEQDDALCKSLAADLAALGPNPVEEVKAASFSKLWDTLRMNSPSSRTTNYVIFDDVDKFSESARRDLVDKLRIVSDRDIGECPIKVLVCGDLIPETGKARILGDELMKDTSVIEIDVDTMKEDLQRYINERLLEPNMLPGQECAEKRRRLEKKLLTTPGCSFRTIEVAMKGIERAIALSEDEQKMFDAVDRSTKDEDNVMKDTVARLQSDLSQWQITLINEILIWVICGNGYESDAFSLRAVEEGLRLRKVKLPVEGLTNFINSRARGLMRIEDTETNIVLEEGVTKAVSKPREVSRGTEPPTISLEIKLVNADIPTARRFFWDLAKFAALDHFDFSADSPNSRLADSKGAIAVNIVDAHLMIVETTLEFLSKLSNPDTENIGPVLVYSLIHHLDVLYEATDLDAIDDELKIKIGKFVYNLFADPRIMETHWKEFEWYWDFLGGFTTKVLWKWLDDETVRRSLGTRDVRWLEHCKASTDKNRELFDDSGLMKMIGRLWLQDKEPHETAVYWIRAFLRKAWNVHWVDYEGNNKPEEESGHKEGDTKESGPKDEEDDKKGDGFKEQNGSKDESNSKGETAPADNIVPKEDTDPKENTDPEENTDPKKDTVLKQDLLLEGGSIQEGEVGSSEVADPKAAAVTESEPDAENEVDPDRAANADYYALFSVATATDIAEAEQWYREKLGVGPDDVGPLWYEKLAKTYASFSMYQEAIVNFQKSVDLAKPEVASWYTMIGLSDALLSEALGRREETTSVSQKAFAIKEKALEIYLGPKGSSIPLEEKLKELESMAHLCEGLQQLDKAFEYRKQALDLDPDNAKAQYAMLSHYIRTDQDSEVLSQLQRVLTKDNEIDDGPGHDSSQLLGLVKLVVEDSMDKSENTLFGRVLSAMAGIGGTAQLLTQLDKALQDAKDTSDSLRHPMLVLHKAMIYFYGDSSDDGEIKRALELSEEAFNIADGYHKAGKPPPQSFYDKITELLGKYYFDQGKQSLTPIQPSAEEEHTRELKRLAAKYEQVIPNGELTAARCFRAALLALRGDGEEARSIFKSDMVQVINMLSDDEQDNDTFATFKLKSILLHSGDYENAFIGLALRPPSIGHKVPGRIRDGLERLLPPCNIINPAEESPATHLLSIYDEEKKAGQTTDSIIQKLIDEAAAKRVGPIREDSTANESNTSSNDPSLTEETSTEDPRTDDIKGATEIKAWSDIHKLLVHVQSQGFLGNDSTVRYCNSCLGSGRIQSNEWDFDNDFYICKYCYDVDLCSRCWDELQAATPGKMHPVCSTAHDWIFLPRWTIETWAESVKSVVHLPLVDGEGRFYPGPETMGLSQWLDMVTRPWGGLQKGKTWDHGKASPVKAEYEVGEGVGGGEQEEEEEEKEDGNGDGEGEGENE